MARTASRTAVLLVRSTVHTWGLPMNASAYGCWEEIWGPTCLGWNPIVFCWSCGVFAAVPVAWWAFRCRSHYCLTSARCWNVAGGTRSRERSLQWERGPRRGSQDRQTPERVRKACTLFNFRSTRQMLGERFYSFSALRRIWPWLGALVVGSHPDSAGRGFWWSLAD